MVCRILDTAPHRDLRTIKHNIDSFKDMLVDGKLNKLTAGEVRALTIDRLDYISKIADMYLMMREEER